MREATNSEAPRAQTAGPQGGSGVELRALDLRNPDQARTSPVASSASFPEESAFQIVLEGFVGTRLVADPDASVCEVQVSAALDAWLRAHHLAAWTGKRGRLALRAHLSPTNTTARLSTIPRRAWRGWRLRTPAELVERLLSTPIEHVSDVADQRVELLAVGHPTIFAAGADDGSPTSPRPGGRRRRLGPDELEGLARLVASAKMRCGAPMVALGGVEAPLAFALQALDRRTRTNPLRFPTLLSRVPEGTSSGPRPATLGALVDVFRLRVFRGCLWTEGAGWIELEEVRRAA